MWVIAVVVPVLLFLIFLLLYNSLVARKNRVEQAAGGIDAQLKKRYDLIPNLVAAVKGYVEHERGTLEELTQIRTKALGGGLTPAEKADLDAKVTSALRQVMVAVEAYPQLQAATTFVQLQRSLNEVEEQLSASRRHYNAAVTDYNNGLEMMPSSLIAKMLGYQRKDVLVIPESERQNVDVGKLLRG